MAQHEFVLIDTEHPEIFNTNELYLDLLKSMECGRMARKILHIT